MIKKIIGLCFIGLLLLALLLSFTQALLRPVDINQFEVRPAERLPRFTLGGFMDSSFQDGTEKALADQVSFSSYLKRAYIELFAAINKLYDPIVRRIPDRYIGYWGMELYNGHLVFSPEHMGDYTEGADKVISQYNEYIAAMPEQEFFLYYVDKDKDCDFMTGEASGVYEYMCAGLNIPEENCAHFTVESYDEYNEKYYFSDHHWNYIGSYEAYLQLLELLRVEDEPLVPLETVQLNGIFYGLNAVNVGSTAFYDQPKAYRFNFEPMRVYLNNIETEDYGAQDRILTGEPISPTYNNFYGPEAGCVSFCTDKTDRDKVLIVADSYDNAVLKLLAGHFNELHSVDIRYYASQVGTDFSLPDYVREHDIDRVVMFGSSEFFSGIAIGEW